ncbi:hypothetical protein [Actinomadura rugatobispora]|uniref:Uncharacterized protein n=1 Tax=Actinomadura rugatobispora TaxID=1994 RepID=A0ABW0ZTX0_9ACTN|nr:hypothetical protein GCM10010200_036500 [Actinomadura rugatobispora]
MESRAEAIALLDVEADTCTGCGQPLSETTHPDAFGGYKTEPPVRCNGCDALRLGQKDYAEVPHFHTLRWRVHRTW